MSFDPDFGTALEAAAAIRAKQVSSVELTEYCFARIERFHPQLNAVILQFRESALAEARKADETPAQSPLHGVPVTVKESFHVVGHPTTWGLPQFAQFRPKHDAAAVERLRAAGAVILGKTNVPVTLGDYQSYNPIYGTTNNPWDLKRSPGGSTGGGAAAVAAGLGYWALGTDSGGSIRMPSHFCGVYGHKPSVNLVSLRGHTPPPVDNNRAYFMDLSVAGPLARSAEDLRETLQVLGGPDGDETVAWKWTLPAPRHKSLQEFRIGYVFNDPVSPLLPEVAGVFESLLERLGKTGVKLEAGWPEGMRPGQAFETYCYLLGASMYSRMPPPVLEALRAKWEKQPNDLMLSGAFAPHVQWVARTREQIASRAMWQRYFETHDAFLMPVAFTPAIEQDQSEPMEARMIGDRRYFELVTWVSFATFAGLPATVAPVGKTAGGLPVGLQIVGPMWEDATPIEVARLLADVAGGFERPPGY